MCSRCSSTMVVRTATRGPNEGNEFWGCKRYPKCRETIAIAAPQAGPQQANNSPSIQPAVETEESSTSGFSAIIDRVAKIVNGIRRYNLESNRPDAAGRWDDDARWKILKYVHQADGGRCGLCGKETPLRGAHIEHIVPKVFGFFDIQNGRAIEGDRYESLEHKMSNLQVAHPYCNKRKGNTATITKWRHPTMQPTTVAIAKDGTKLSLPG